MRQPTNVTGLVSGHWYLGLHDAPCHPKTRILIVRLYVLVLFSEGHY